MMLVAASRGRATGSGVLLCALILGAFLWSHQKEGTETPASGTLHAEYRNGSCLTDIRINNVLFRDALLDTGASGTVLLGSNHAWRLGLNPRTLSFSNGYSSANGDGRYAVVRVQELRLGGFVMRDDLTIAVTQVDQDQVLLGLEILNRLHFRVSGHSCELGT